MIEIRTNGEVLDLPSGFSIEIEDSSPVFNDRGSQSVPATVPATGRNIRILDFPDRIDTGVDPNSPARSADVVEGGYMRRGTMNITEAGATEGITFNIGFDNSTAYARWSNLKLSELSCLPVWEPDPGIGDFRMSALLYYLDRIYREGVPHLDEFAVFPVAVNSETDGSDDDAVTYWEILNVPGENGLNQPGTVMRIIDGEVTEVTVPAGYMVSPFLRVWRIIELVFLDLGLDVPYNPFREDPELARLVLLNNAADSACAGRIKYADLMPDCTVAEFLNSLWVRFGLVYNIDRKKSAVTLSLLKDIISRRDCRALEDGVTGPELVRYESPRYVRLSARTSIEGAAPACDRFEDFVKGLDLSKVRVGRNVAGWISAGSRNNPHWSGESLDGVIDWSGEGDRDYVTDGSFLAREWVTGRWFWLDGENSGVRDASSPFFNWDPQPQGMDALDLSSEDECVPVGSVDTGSTGVGNPFRGLCPLYLTGTRHYHSYIKGSGDAGDSGEGTPLAFMLAYTAGGKTVGRLAPEGEDGKTMVLDDGTSPTLSLLFQFRDGLFARFWKGYDEILRHGNRTVEVNTRINKLDLSGMDLLRPYTFRGVRVLVDTMDYVLPSGREVSVDLKLRTIQTQGRYDIDAEQGIPVISSGGRPQD